MSSSDSNLNSIGYDMVVGLTQNSINSTMKKVIKSVQGTVETICYVYTDGFLTDVEPISYQELLDKTKSDEFPDGVDPFSVSNGAKSNDPDSETVAKGNALYQALFAFAFQAGMGMPEMLNDAPVPDIILLQDQISPQRVNYQMYFKTFQIVQLTAGVGVWSFDNFHQMPGAPWIFGWEVNLDLESSSFEDLPQETQDSIKNLDNSSMFSVQQLLLDLSTPALSPNNSTTVEIQTTLGANSPAWNLLQTDFLNTYWASLQATGNVVFSYAIQPTNSQPNTAQPSLIPTDLNFVVTPYIPSSDETLTEAEQNGLYTLNYLIMANGNQMPSPVAPLPWNWLNKAEDHDNDGIVSIKKNDFVAYLKNLLAGTLSTVCIQPTVDMKMDGLKVHYSWGATSPNPMPQYSVVNQEGSTHVLTCDYDSKEAYDEIFLQGDTTITSSTNVDVYLQGQTIKCVTTVAVYLDIGLAGVGGHDISHTRGAIFAKKNTTTFTMSANINTGSLHVDMQVDLVDLTQSSNKNAAYYDGDLNASFFAEMLTFGDIDDMVSSIQSYYTNKMSSYLNNYNSNILNLLNNLNAWVFPGASTFSYSNCAFSDFQDLTTMVSYVDPT